MLPKIDELRHIARLTNAAVIGISESKVDDSVPTSKIQIDEYDLLRCDRNRHGGGVVCYVRNTLSYNVKSYFPKDIESILFELLLPNTKPIVVGAIYCPPNQTNFMEIFNENLSKVDTNNVESYILGDFSIICGRMVIMFSKNTICFHVIQSRMMLKITLISAQCLA